MRVRPARKIARNSLMCLAIGGAIVTIAASLANSKRLNGAYEGSGSEEPTRPASVADANSKAAFDSLVTFNCPNEFIGRHFLKSDPCYLRQLRGQSRFARARGPVVIPVYFHILKNRADEGHVADKSLETQVKVLNDAFAGTPFRFVLAGRDITVRDDWFDMVYSRDSPTQAERAAKYTLNKPGNSTLNIYTARVSGYQGWARWPWQLGDRVDGVVVKYSTLPDGATPYYNLGYVVVHEVGHWLGLFHTSERRCYAPGDCVDDTPAEESAKTDCQDGIDSCPGPGVDPYRNFMNYTDDKCKNQFTRGQMTRMIAIYSAFRM
jgi:Pregnancy-associated plasma protein-A